MRGAHVVGDGLCFCGFIPILFKQIPYTMAKFAVQGKAAEAIYGSMGSSPDKMSKGGQARAAPAFRGNPGAR